MTNDLDKLKSQLLVSGLQQKDNPLFQVINQLITYLSKTINSVNGLLLSSSSATVHGTSSGLQGPPGMDGFDGEIIETMILVQEGIGQRKGYWVPVTDGDILEPQIIYANGEAVVAFIPTNN